MPENEVLKSDTIQFLENNPYMDKSDNLKLARQLVDEGKTQDAMVCLEAEV